jgi:crotonobetainyl-CoA:carnitine CoA-transferase CaiB-like acyl-CoA transferase
MRSGGVTGLHPTKDGFLYLSANTPHFWSSLCELTGLSELGADPRYDTVRKRAELAKAILPKLRATLLTRTALEWERIFGDRVPCAAARAIEDMFSDPQVLAENLVADFDHPLVGRYRGFTRAVTFDRTPGPEPFAAPTFGQHSDAVLKKMGYASEDIVDLRRRGVVGPMDDTHPRDVDA